MFLVLNITIDNNDYIYNASINNYNYDPKYHLLSAYHMSGTMLYKHTTLFWPLSQIFKVLI